MFVLGIDPGLSRCGFGLVRRARQRNEAEGHGFLHTPPTDELPARLASMNSQLRALIAQHHPDVVVVERVFFQTNARTAMGVAQASGLALAAAHDAGCVIAQYTSNEVKLAIAGYGGASKDQVQRMVQRILGMAELPKPADAADALALALHHLAVAPMLARVGDASGVAALRVAASVGAVGDGGHGLGNARIATSAGGVRLAGNLPAARNGGTR